MSNLKQQLYVQCREYIRSHEAEIRTAISEAQEAANEESKSSAGDKFETGREVMQQEIDLNLTRLGEVNKLKEALEKIPFDITSDTIQPGSVVKTSNGNYYLAIGAGKLNVDGSTYYSISPAAPIGTQLSGLKVGDQFNFNGKDYKIEWVS
ncbi:MAG: 3-oxoacyl-ACP synthase [Bacteroidota bacterium]